MTDQEPSAWDRAHAIGFRDGYRLASERLAGGARGGRRRVLVCGPEASGTQLVARIVATDPRALVIHRSLPHGDEWWDWRLATRADEAVVVLRRPDVRALSAIKATHVRTLAEAESEYSRAIADLARIPDAVWISYEALVADPDTQIATLGRRLGLELRAPERIEDRNAPWIPLLGRSLEPTL